MIKKLVFATSFLIVLTTLVVINPILIGNGNVADFLVGRIRTADLASVRYEETKDSGNTLFTYRGNSQRTGQVSLKVLRLRLVLDSISETLNFGVHTASKSSAAVDSSGYYVGTDEGRFLAYNLDGKLRWEVNAVSSMRGIHGTATTDELYIYIGNYRGHLLCLRKTDGKIMWDTVVADAIGTSPLLVEDFLYVTAEFNGKASLVAKLAKKTGEKIWVSEVFADQSHSSPAISEEGRMIVVGDNTGTLRGLDARTGERIWREKLGGEVKGTPMIFQGNVYIGSWGKDFCSFNVLSGEKNWCRTMPGMVQASAAVLPLSGDLIVQSSSKNSLLRLRARDGSIVWQQNYNVGTRIGISSPVVLVNSNNGIQILAGCAKKELCLLDPETGKSISSVSLPQVFSAVPSVFNEFIYLPLDNGGLARIRAR